MSNSIKVRAKTKDGAGLIKILINHPMETGLRKDKKTGKKIPAHFIQNVSCEHKGVEVISAHCSTAVSANPFFFFKIKKASSGDSLKISWADNKGESDSVEAKIK